MNELLKKLLAVGLSLTGVLVLPALLAGCAGPGSVSQGDTLSDGPERGEVLEVVVLNQTEEQEAEGGGRFSRIFSSTYRGARDAGVFDMNRGRGTYNRPRSLNPLKQISYHAGYGYGRTFSTLGRTSDRWGRRLGSWLRR